MSQPHAQQKIAVPIIIKHPGERLAEYYADFFKTVTAISTLGASITFSKIVQGPATPWADFGFSKTSIQNYLGLSFLFYALGLGLTTFAASALSRYRPSAVEWFGTDDSHRRRIVAWYATVVTSILYGLLISAFIFLSLVITALIGPSGWTALGFTIMFGVLGFGVIVWQSPIGSPPPPSDHRRHRSRPSGPQGYPSPSTRHHSTAPLWPEDDYDLKYPPREPQPRYTGDGMGKRTPLHRPMSDLVPPYMADLRRARSERENDDERFTGWDEKQSVTVDVLDTLTYDDQRGDYMERDEERINQDRRWVAENSPGRTESQYGGHRRYNIET